MEKKSNITGRTLYDFLSELIYDFPKWLKFCIILFLLAIATVYIYNKYKNDNEVNSQKLNLSEKCMEFAIQGRLIWKNKRTPLDHVTIKLDNGNSFEKDEYLEEGVFWINNINISDKKHISLLIFTHDNILVDSKSYRISDESISYDNCTIDLGTEMVDDLAVKKNNLEK